MTLQRSNTRATNPELREDLDLLQAQVDAGGGGTVPDASETVKGKVELATISEAEAGIDTSRAVTPAGLAAAIAAIGGGSALQTDVFHVSGSPHTWTKASGSARLYVYLIGGGGGGGVTQAQADVVLHYEVPAVP